MDRIRGEAHSRRLWLNEVEVSPGPSQKLMNHSPDGFNWGYGGSGPAQAALALLLAAGLKKADALALYQAFKWSFVARWPDKDFEAALDIQEWVEAQVSGVPPLPGAPGKQSVIAG